MRKDKKSWPRYTKPDKPSLYSHLGDTALARQWLDDYTLLVEFCGHTDQPPVVQFDDLFHVGLDGSVRQVSKRENLSPYADACTR